MAEAGYFVSSKCPLSSFVRDSNWIFVALLLPGASTGTGIGVAPVDKLSVAFAMVLAFIFLGETFSSKVGPGGALVVMGPIVIALA